MENVYNKDYKKRLKDIRRKRQINNFYMKRIKDGKSRKAVYLDNIIIKTIMGLFLYFFILFGTKNWVMSLILSILIFSAYIYISYKIKTKRYCKKVKEINEEMGNRLVSSKIMNLSNKEFLEYNKEILEKYYKTNFVDTNKGNIDLVGEVQGHSYGVKSIKTNLDNRINLKDLESFFNELKTKKIERAIIITNTYFTEEVIEFVKDNIVLIDFYEITKLLKKVDLYPKKDEIEDLIHSRREQRRKKIIKERKDIFVLGKIIRYFILAIALWFLSYFVPYSYYYRFMAVMLVILSIIGFTGYIVRLIKKKKEIILHK